MAKVEQLIRTYPHSSLIEVERAIKSMKEKSDEGWKVAAMASTPENSNTFGRLIVVYEREVEEENTNKNNIE